MVGVRRERRGDRRAALALGAVHDRIGAGLHEPRRPALAEALQDLRVERARRDRRDDAVGRAPAQILRRLERDRLRSLRVVGAHAHVHERPRALVGELRAQPVHVVVGAVHGEDGRAVGRRGDDLLALEIRRHEDVGREPQSGGRGRGGPRQVARRRAGERLVAELDRLGGGHRDDPVLERMGRVRRLGLDVEIAVEAELRRQPVGADERRAPHRQSARRRRDGQEVGVAPERRRPGLHGLAADGRVRRRRSRPRAGRSTGRRRRAPRAGRRRNSLCRRVERPSWSIPQVGGHIYRGGAPPDLAPFSADRSGCRGFTGPVPPPLWMRFTGDRPRQRFFPIVAGSV